MKFLSQALFQRSCQRRIDTKQKAQTMNDLTFDPFFRMLAVGEVGSWLPPWNPVPHHLESRLDSEAPHLKTREEVVKPIPERIRKKSRKKTAEQVAASSFEVERRSGSSSGEPHADLATQVRKN